MPRRRARAGGASLALVVLVGLLGAPPAVAASVIPNQGVDSTSGWQVSGTWRTSFDERESALVVRPVGRSRSATVTSSPDGATVSRGTTVQIAGEVRAARVGVPVVVQVLEADPITGETLRSSTARRTTTTTGYQWYGAEITTASRTSRIRISVSTRAVGRTELRIRGFDSRVGPPTSSQWSTESPASRWVDQHPRDGRTSVIRDRIARRPTSTWLLGEENPYERLAASVGRAQAEFRTAVVTPYDVPGRWDGLSGKAGAPSVAAYREFTDRVADAIGSARAVVVLEPDALWFYAQVKRRLDAGGDYCEDGLGCYDRADLVDRVAALRYAIGRYTTLPRTQVYVEAGTSSGSVTPEEMASALRTVGVGTDRVGFAVNVSSYAPEAAITRWAISVRSELARLGVRDARYVVDTGRNGNRRWTGLLGDTDDDGIVDQDADGDGDEDARDLMAWCNPDGQRLGLAPGPASAAQRAQGRDWNLWVKGPGESDGDCGAGPGTSGGEFMPDVAYRMAK